MKTFLALSFGFLVGCYFGVTSPTVIKAVAGTGAKVASQATDTVAQAAYDGCRADFLAETKCYQNQKAADCEAQIEKRCR